MLILFNARIYTGTSSSSPLTALAIDHGRIIAVGSDAEIRDGFGSKAELQDLAGAAIWPGLVDAHLHLQHYSLGLQRVDCETDTQAECIRRVAERAQKSKPGEWILGHGWNQNVWPEGFGTASQLDAVAPNNPVYLTSKSIHSAWANTRALQLADIGPGSQDPEGGAFQRDPNGNLTGILLEEAMGVVSAAIPRPTISEIQKAFEAAQPHLWRMGLTGVHDYDQADCFAALQEMHRAHCLGLRVVKSIPLDNLDNVIAIGLRSGFGDEWLRIGSIKLFADGALGPQTAAMLQPYEGGGQGTGYLLLDAETIVEYGQQAVQGGFSLAIHAIGDLANHEVLNAYEQLRGYETAHNLQPMRHRIEHVQLIHPDDYPRLAKLNVIASMQPIHATSDMFIADKNWGKRSRHSYAWQGLLNQNTVLAFGSDAPVESPNPFWGLHAAVTRRRVDGSPGPEGWYPEQKISLQAALKAFTEGAAYAAGTESFQGKIAPGYLADLTVLEQDPFRIPPEELVRLAPVATMVGGEWKYQA